MHSYASDSIDRRVSPWVIAVLSVAITYLFNLTAKALNITIPWWCEAPSVMSVYGLLYILYNRWVWRWSFGPFQLSRIPNCNGTWYGEATSTHDGGTIFAGMLTVHQTWTKIAVQFRTSSSISYSRMAALNVTPGASEGLIYEYTNDPHATAAESMHAHRGFIFLKLSTDGCCLEGDYYTGRDRANQGRLKLQRVARKILSLSQAKAEYEKMGMSKNER